MKASDGLRAARDLCEKGWTQWAFARDTFGNPCSIAATNASCFCASGAIMRAGVKNVGIFPQAVEAFSDANDISHIPQWNDRVTKAEVLAAFDKAIAYAKERETVPA